MRIIGVMAGVLAVAALSSLEHGAPPATLEDIYGPSGNSFQAALGFRVFEGDEYTGPARPGYGVGVDDVVVQWREYKLVEDATDCATSGNCASLVVDSGRPYDGDEVLVVRILDSSPYGALSPADRNDCNGNGSYVDPGDDTDCNDNGVSDVTIVAKSVAEPAGKTFVADRILPGVYLATIALSTTVGAIDVLRIAEGGDQTPEVTLTYEDRWDGGASGQRCKNSVDPAQQGFVVEAVEVGLVTGDLDVVSYRVEEVNGDLDGFPDTNETIDLYVTVKNRTTASLTNVTVGISSTDPKIDCMQMRVAFIPALDPRGTPGAMRETPTPFRLHVASTADRSGAAPAVACNSGVCSNGAGACTTAAQCVRGVSDLFAARLAVSIAADQIDGAILPQRLDVELDLDSTAPSAATSAFVEGFENGLGNFTLMNLDVGIASNAASNGARCQYNDPDYPNSNSYGDSECYLGFPSGQPIANDWHPHTTTEPDGGRAFAGTRSLHYGKHIPGNPSLDTYGLSQMDAVRTFSAINLAARICIQDPAASPRACNSAADCVAVGGGACSSASPKLSFKHQIFIYDRAAPYESQPWYSGYNPAGVFAQQLDRAILGAQVAGSTRYDKLYPYENVYEVSATDEFSSCAFDPTDDGSTESDYFDPGDPNRRYGPSSTCAPELVFGWLGDTNNPYSAWNIGRASDGPGLAGSLGIGTWVESKVDLSRYRGRSIRIRFLVTTLKISDVPDYQYLYHWNPMPKDDGWYIDDVRVTQTLGATTSTLAPDLRLNAALSGCGAVACSTLAPALSIDPPSGTVPGQRVTLSALASVADQCTGGALLFRFFVDNDASSTFSPGDAELTPFGVSPIYIDAPLATTRYGVTVRCSAGGSGGCTGSDSVATYSLPCDVPPEIFDPALWWARGVRWSSKTTLSLPPMGEIVDVVRGDLGSLRGTGSFSGSSQACLADDVPGPQIPAAQHPPLGSGYYYLLRGQVRCNDRYSYRTFAPRENPTEPSKRDNEIVACPP